MNFPRGQLRTTQVWLGFQNGRDPEVEPALKVSQLILSDRQHSRRILNQIGSKQLPSYLTSSALVPKPVAFEQFSKAVRLNGTLGCASINLRRNVGGEQAQRAYRK